MHISGKLHFKEPIAKDKMRAVVKERLLVYERFSSGRLIGFAWRQFGEGGPGRELHVGGSGGHRPRLSHLRARPPQPVRRGGAGLLHRGDAEHQPRQEAPAVALCAHPQLPGEQGPIQMLLSTLRRSAHAPSKPGTEASI
eukprot:1188637-Prorocentrum_minimum.AAC.2